MTLAHDLATRQAARHLYVREALALELIAIRLKLSVHTLMRWRRDEGDWDRQRAAARLSGAGAKELHGDLMEDFVLSWKAVHNELRTNPDIPALAKVDALSRLADSYIKTVSAGAKGDPKLNKLAVGMAVIEGFLAHVKAHHAADASAILPALESFAPKLADLLA